MAQEVVLRPPLQLQPRDGCSASRAWTLLQACSTVTAAAAIAAGVAAVAAIFVRRGPSWFCSPVSGNVAGAEGAAGGLRVQNWPPEAAPAATCKAVVAADLPRSQQRH